MSSISRTAYVLDEPTMKMISTLVRYVSEDGFDGFLAHIEQTVTRVVRGDCDCGKPHEMPKVEASMVRLNLERLKAAVKEARR
jgi:hypothetical protein